MLTMPSFKKGLIVEQFQGNYLKVQYVCDRFMNNLQLHSKWFVPRSISSSYSMIVRVSVVLRRTVVGD